MVSLAVTDPSITAPLYTRGYGLWESRGEARPEATHPRIREFDISTEDRELLQKAEAYIREQAEQTQQAAAQTGAQKRTFGRDRLDRRQAAAAADAAADGDDPVAAALQRMTAADVLLLARFFDVAVEPGQAYRYRMRLVVANPNFGLGAADVSDPAALEGETRKTRWSEPSGVAIVPPDEYVYLAKLREGPADGLPQARLDVTEFSRDYGTYVSEGSPPMAPGDLLTFTERRTEVLDPFKLERNDRAEYVFDTDHLVLAVEPLPQDAAGLHPDLNLADREVPPGRVLLLLGTGAVEEIDAGLAPARARVAGDVQKLRDGLGPKLTDVNAKPAQTDDP